jgi:hypothetical protein
MSIETSQPVQAAYTELEKSKWGSIDDQLFAANELVLALKQAKLEEVADESGTFVPFPRLEPTQVKPVAAPVN